MARRFTGLLLAGVLVASSMGVAGPAFAAGGDGCVTNPAVGKKTCISATWDDYTYYDSAFALAVTPYVAGLKTYPKNTRVQVRFRAAGTSKWVVRSTKAGRRGKVTFTLGNKRDGTYQIRLLVKVKGVFTVAQSERFPSPGQIGD